MNIDWTEKPGNRLSQVNLMREYLRRSARWSEEIGSLWPFDDFARRVDPDVRADQKIVEEMEESLPTLVFPWSSARVPGRCTSKPCGMLRSRSPTCRIRSNRCCSCTSAGTRSAWKVQGTWRLEPRRYQNGVRTNTSAPSLLLTWTENSWTTWTTDSTGPDGDADGKEDQWRSLASGGGV